MTTHPEDAMTRERAEEEALQIAEGLRPSSPNREHIARSLWESQRARIHNQEGINARLSWRDKSVPEAFWHHYELDADAVITAFASAQQEPAPAADAEEIARKAAEQIVDELAAKAMHYRLGRIQTIIASALRRYAGDGGVTEQRSEEALEDAAVQLEARAYDLETLYEKKLLADELFDIAQELRSRAAARAKSGEKGGAR